MRRARRSVLGLTLAAVAAAGCDSAGPGGANTQVEITVASVVLDGDGLPRPGGAPAVHQHRAGLRTPPRRR